MSIQQYSEVFLETSGVQIHTCAVENKPVNNSRVCGKTVLSAVTEVRRVVILGVV